MQPIGCLVDANDRRYVLPELNATPGDVAEGQQLTMSAVQETGEPQSVFPAIDGPLPRF